MVSSFSVSIQLWPFMIQTDIHMYTCTHSQVVVCQEEWETQVQVLSMIGSEKQLELWFPTSQVSGLTTRLFWGGWVSLLLTRNSIFVKTICVFPPKMLVLTNWHFPTKNSFVGKYLTGLLLNEHYKVWWRFPPTFLWVPGSRRRPKNLLILPTVLSGIKIRSL